jgi:hypothetical protein
MGTLILFKSSGRSASSLPAVNEQRHACEVVIFPGVRIERHTQFERDLDLSHRICDSAGRDDFGGGNRPRKTS